MATAKKTVDEYTLLRDLILQEKVYPNERLVETEYAERFGTNRSNIRKALARLEQEGLVVCEPFRGAHVRQVTEAEAIELFEVRAALEIMLVPHAVARVTAADRKVLKGLLKKMRELQSNANVEPVAAGLASRQMRRELWRISGHNTATVLLEKLNTQLVRIWFRGIAMPGRAQAMMGGIGVVVEAVCAGSSVEAVDAMRAYHEAAISNLKLAISIKNPLPLAR